jgi:DNA-binding NarL/FixJ family response regulator
MKKIRLAMCDDVKSLCKYFKQEFDMHEDIEFVGAVHNSKQCIKMVKEKKPDVLLLDIQMETNDEGVMIIPEIRQVSPETKIIMLTIHEENDYIFKSFALGAIDYQIKTAPIENILESIRAVYSNTSLLRPEIAQKILIECENMSQKHETLLYTFNLLTKLSNAEFEILKDLYYGYSYKEIAQKRFVEESTIRSQVTRLLKKFEAKNMRVLIKSLRNMKAFDTFIN